MTTLQTTINAIKEYCKFMDLKFVRYTNNGFVGEGTSDVRAGMETINGKIISMKIRKIGTKKTRYLFICHDDGDIQWGEKINN